MSKDLSLSKLLSNFSRKSYSGSHKKSLFYLVTALIIALIYLNYDQIKVWFLIRIVVNRGILAPNCFWYKISDIFLSDATGINIYNKFKAKYGDFAPLYMFGNDIFLVTNNDCIKTILDNSPNTFGVGKLKQQFFRSFMEKNVGVSQGCPWKQRRGMNDHALNTDVLHIHATEYNEYIHNYFVKNNWNEKSTFQYDDFVALGKFMASKIVFGTDTVYPEAFKIFDEANTTRAYDDNFKLNNKVYVEYSRILHHFIQHPADKSLVKQLLEVSNNKEEIFHQIPHFIFPIVGLFITSAPRLLLFLLNSPENLEKVLEEIGNVRKRDLHSNEYFNGDAIYQLSFLRKCVLETVRLNNPVITTFRTLLQDYSFPGTNKTFTKGTQFLILNNPVLRENEFFVEPNVFNPSRWTSEMEKSYYAISFNQGPQKCPGKELAIYLIQSFVYNFLVIKNIVSTTENIKTNYIDIGNVPQIINPCTIKINVI